MRVLTFAPPEAWVKKEGYDLKLLALAPVSSTRFLAAFKESIHRLDKWADEEAIKREAQEKGVVSSVKLTKVQDGVFLAFLGKDGRILQRSTLGPEMDYKASTDDRGAYAVLVMEEAERCPYGLFRPDVAELWCETRS
jgi:hypothetical protein